MCDVLMQIAHFFSGTGCVSSLLRLYAQGKPPPEESIEAGKPVAEKKEENFCMHLLKLLFCAGGLLTFYLTWGLMQERIMAFKYGQTADNEGENFKDSLFLVFVNRILALFVAIAVLQMKQSPNQSPPLYKYSYCSFSNIMSSWFQFEALKFVSFPVQVLSKACKVIPVMIMGTVVSKRTYPWHEYVTALMISVGISMFLLTSSDAVRGEGTSTTFSGIIILVGYLTFDSFTANWQSEIFKTYKVNSFQMMAGVNFFSVTFTAVSLIEQGGFIESVAFMGRHPEFIQHSLLLGTCSAIGQLFIFYTINQFGPVTFTLIMTVRQGFSFLLSCIIYRHPVTMTGILGILIVFAAMFIRNRCSQQPKKLEVTVKPVPDNAPLTVKITIPNS